MGLHLAGFDVIGIDIAPQPRYPFRFIRGDALAPPVDLTRFDLIWASPQCERFTRVWRGQEHRRDDYPDQIEPIRQLLLASGVAFVIENVPEAPVRADVVLTGAQFGLPIVRRRHFECERFTPPFALNAEHWPERTTRNGGLAMIAGRGGAMKGWNRRNWEKPEIRAKLAKRNSVAGWREAMQMPWADRDGIRKAVPPAYAEHIGRAFLEFVR